jgi:hypothetical protein
MAVERVSEADSRTVDVAGMITFACVVVGRCKIFRGRPRLLSSPCPDAGGTAL